jgi:hypothetical protein
MTSDLCGFVAYFKALQRDSQATAVNYENLLGQVTTKLRFERNVIFWRSKEPIITGKSISGLVPDSILQRT